MAPILAANRATLLVLLFAMIGCAAPDEAPTGEPAPVAATPWIDAERADWWRDAVVYEVFVRSFFDSREGEWADDGVGDLDGLIARLDYLNDGDPSTDGDLEVDALWLMPIFESPSYHGYDVVDYRSIERDYGDLAAFRRLVDACHRRGMRVILDLVVNHTSDRHPWFRDAWREGSPFHDWYRFATEPQGYGGPWGQRVWHQLPWWQRGPEHFSYRAFYGIFSRRMPDLDHTNREVEAALHEIARFWIEQGADGFRLDAARHLVEDGAVQANTPATHAWLRRFGAFLDSVDPRVAVVAEIWDDAEIVATYGPDEADLLFQFDLAEAILQAVRDGDSIGPSGRGLRSAMDAVVAAFPDGRNATFLSNHDQVRVMSHLDGDEAGARLAASLLLTLPGTPFLYYGEEIGLQGRKPDPKIRTPMPWDASRHAGFSTDDPWIDPRPEAETIHVAAQDADAGSLLVAYRRLVRLRHRTPALRRGGYVPIATEAPALFAFLRPLDGEASVAVVANLGPSEAAMPALPGQPSRVLLELPGVDAPHGGDARAPIPGRSTRILLLDEAEP